MKYNCKKCGYEGEMKNPFNVKGGQVTGHTPSKEHKEKIGATRTKRWDEWREKHGKTKVIRNRPGKPRIKDKRLKDSNTS